MTEQEKAEIHQFVSWAQFQEVKNQIRDMHIAMMGNEYHKGFFDQFQDYQVQSQDNLEKCQVECQRRRKEYWKEVNSLKLRLLALIMVLIGLGIISIKEVLTP